MSTINTAYGRRHVFRTVVYGSATYVNTLPIPSEPHGAWFVMNPQRGWVDVPRNGRTLTLAIAEHNAANPNNYVFA